MKDEIEILFLGDTMLGGIYMDTQGKGRVEWEKPFEEVKQLIDGADIVLFNLEGPFADKGPVREDVTAIISNDARILNLFNKCGKPVACLANNHIMDYGEQGLVRTLDILESQGVGHTGAGRRIGESKKPHIASINKKSIAFIAYTTNEPWVGSIIADEAQAGCTPIDAADIDDVLTTIRELKNQNDYVCVSVHWGKEYYEYPEPVCRRVFRDMVAAGADFVIGHHPHVVQGMEIFQGKLICYSLGNFFLPLLRGNNGRVYLRPPSSKEFMAVRVVLDSQDNMGVELIAGKMKATHLLKIYRKRKYRSFVSRVDGLSVPLKNDEYERFYNYYEQKVQKNLLLFNIYKAVYQLTRTPIGILIKTVKMEDVRRFFNNLAKLVGVAGKNRN